MLVLYPHQEKGVEWMVNRENCQKCPGGLLLDDCGLGKTPQVIATLVRNPQKATLVVAPVNILKQWQAQLYRWAPHFKVLLFHGLPTKDKQCVIGKEIDKLYNLAKNAQEYAEFEQKNKTVDGKKNHNHSHRSDSSDQEMLMHLLTHSKKQVFSSNNNREHHDSFQEKHKTEYTSLTCSMSSTDMSDVPLVVLSSYGQLTNYEFERVRKRLYGLGLLHGPAKTKTGQTMLNQVKWDRVVLDECHLIRNHGTTR